VDVEAENSAATYSVFYDGTELVAPSTLGVDVASPPGLSADAVLRGLNTVRAVVPTADRANAYAEAYDRWTKIFTHQLNTDFDYA